jgi:omega-6 fatty acid desaturase (delta-12 desaturase)
LQYWRYRNPVVMIGLGALFMFLLRNRLPTRWVKRKERVSVLFTNLLIVVVILVANRFIGCFSTASLSHQRDLTDED